MKPNKKDKSVTSGETPKPLYPDHKLVTRRDFLAQGLIGFSTSVLMPGMLGMILKQHNAMAAGITSDCPSAVAGAGLLPFLVFDCAGGSSLSGNWVPTDQGGALLPSYSAMGLGSGSQLQITSQFGAPMAVSAGGITPRTGSTNVSQVLEGILATTTPACQSVLRMGLFAHTGQSDSSDNQHSALLQVARAGYQGSLLRTGLGMRTSNSGGNSDVPIFDPSLKPLRVTSFNDLAGALGYGAALQALPKSTLDAMAKATLNLTATQASNLNGMNLGEQFGQLARCGYAKNMDYTSTPAGIDPRQDPVFQARYNITTATGVTNADVVKATIVMNVLKGNSGPGVITIGGCDYHDGTQTSGDTKDLEIGREIGRALQAAFDLGKPLVFQVISDGAILSGNNNRVWSGDSNEKSLTVMGAMIPTGAPNMLRTQIGYYTSGQGAATGTIIGADPQKVAHSVFANYLSLSRKMDLYQKYSSGSGAISPNLIDQVLLFA